MSYITLKVRYKEATKKDVITYPSLMDKLKGFYHKVNDYFGLAEGTSDIAWFYGFGAFCFATVSIVIMY